MHFNFSMKAKMYSNMNFLLIFDSVSYTEPN